MSERITLSYTINLDELGAETYRLYERAQKKMKDATLQSFSIDDILEHRVAESLDKLRQQLMDIDLCLSDMSSIILAYNQHRANPTVQNEQHIGDDIDSNLDEKIKDFNDKISSL